MGRSALTGPITHGPRQLASFPRGCAGIEVYGAQTAQLLSCESRQPTTPFYPPIRREGQYNDVVDSIEQYASTSSIMEFLLHDKKVSESHARVGHLQLCG